MTRRPYDYYPTGGGEVAGESPTWAAQALYRRCPQIRGIVEPCVGTGDLVRGREDMHWTNDLDIGRQATAHLDMCDPASWARMPQPPWVVTNPPFNVAHLILANALDCARDGVAFLLRLTFLEPVEARARLLRERPPKRLIVLPRISFTGDGKMDSVTCAWMLWGDAAPGIEVVGKAEKAGGDGTEQLDMWGKR